MPTPPPTPDPAPAPLPGTAPESVPEAAPQPAPTDLNEIERGLSRLTYLAGRARHHEHLKSVSGLPLDRAAVAILRRLAGNGGEAPRPGALAVRLSVEASHVARQLRHLEEHGYVVRVPDPDDRRAQRVRLTDAGQAAIDRVREVSRRSVEEALADWSPEELREFATLFRRLVDDFTTRSEKSADARPSA
ncbi:MarR family winged helix-turn-helix transcriptional regulator [Streptomyces sp. NPDC096310]|uniref:MarR family winged helix-turn-helix transcriptional regulator n=1 Tax=Streptomyces sp. NPDC096310 TaxID=3366082 RepID=UPI00382A7678